MKQDFTLAKEELNEIGILRVAADFYSEPRRRGSAFFVRSPKTADKHASMALYPGSNRYTDFANGGESGDIISFVAYVKGCNQWEALGELRDFYGLTNAGERDREETRRRILLQQQEERQKEECKKAFRAALAGQIGELKQWADICKIAIERAVYEPCSPMWCYCINELQKTEYKLDILAGVDCKTYPRLKPYHENLPSDRYEWLLDSLAILAECGTFTATKDELKEIQAQADYEARRVPGAAERRRCKIEW